jgi:hypothetical protein
MLVAMATGTGKTFTTVNQIYRLMKSGVGRRILFLVDRCALAAPEDCYLHWVRHFIVYHDKRHARDMGAAEVQHFLTHLAVDGRVSASTLNQPENGGQRELP